MKIAIIEDDKITRLELSKLLNSHGYETVLLTDFENLSEESKNILSIWSYWILIFHTKTDMKYAGRWKAHVCTDYFCDKQGHKRRRTAKYSGRRIDFITKPYDTLILLEKIKRALQLSNPNNFRELTKKDCTLDLHLSVLKYEGKSIELTRNEFRILYIFSWTKIRSSVKKSY